MIRKNYAITRDCEGYLNDIGLVGKFAGWEELGMLRIYICIRDNLKVGFWKNIITKASEIANIRDLIITDGKWRDVRSAVEQDTKSRWIFFVDIDMLEEEENRWLLAQKSKYSNENYFFIFITNKRELIYKVFEYRMDALDCFDEKDDYYRVNSNKQELINRWVHILNKLDEGCGDKKNKVIQFEADGIMYKINTRDILYIQTIKSTHLVEICVDNKIIRVRKSLAELIKQLGFKEFAYVNKSCIVSKDKVLEIDKRNRRMILQGDVQVDISIREMKKICDDVKKFKVK